MPRKERVSRVVDGDTFRTGSRRNSVRLANVLAPEKGKRGGTTATNALRKMIGGKDVSIRTVARDKYGRSVAHVSIGGKSVNRAMQKRLGR